MLKAAIGFLVAVAVLTGILVAVARKARIEEREGVPELVETQLPAGGASTGGQLIQMQPDTSPPVAEGDKVNQDKNEKMGADATQRPIRRGGYAELIVSITDSGFEPAKQTVPAGYTVTFVNDGQAAHWPASDDHPTHAKLPGFNANRGLATGEEYSFTFTKAGEWGYHDHLNTGIKGVIVVE